MSICMALCVLHLVAVGAGVEAGVFIELQLKPKRNRVPDARRGDARRQLCCHGRHVGLGIIEVEAHRLNDWSQRPPLAPAGRRCCGPSGQFSGVHSCRCFCCSMPRVEEGDAAAAPALCELDNLIVWPPMPLVGGGHVELMDFLNSAQLHRLRKHLQIYVHMV